jgi:phosphocarrier protein
MFLLSPVLPLYFPLLSDRSHFYFHYIYDISSLLLHKLYKKGETGERSDLKVIAKKPIYAKDAGQFVQFTSRFEEPVYVKKGEKTADGKSLLGLISLSIQPGQEIEITSRADLAGLQDQLFQSDLFENAD